MEETPQTPATETKSPWKSKTIWIAVITALSALAPSVQKVISENPAAFAQVMACVFLVLRTISSGKISIE